MAKGITHKDILKWEDELLDIISKHTDDDLIIWQIVKAASAASRGKPLPSRVSSETQQDRPE